MHPYCLIHNMGLALFVVQAGCLKIAFLRRIPRRNILWRGILFESKIPVLEAV